MGAYDFYTFEQALHYFCRSMSVRERNYLSPAWNVSTISSQSAGPTRHVPWPVTCPNCGKSLPLGTSFRTPGLQHIPLACRTGDATICIDLYEDLLSSLAPISVRIRARVDPWPVKRSLREPGLFRGAPCGGTSFCRRRRLSGILRRCRARARRFRLESGSVLRGRMQTREKIASAGSPARRHRARRG